MTSRGLQQGLQPTTTTYKTCINLTIIEFTRRMPNARLCRAAAGRVLAECCTHLLTFWLTISSYNRLEAYYCTLFKGELYKGEVVYIIYCQATAYKGGGGGRFITERENAETSCHRLWAGKKDSLLPP